jgi:putative membrane protein
LGLVFRGDEEWLKMSIEGDRFEIIGGQIAQSRTSTWFIKALGNKLTTDHSKSLREAADLAHALGIEVPGSPSPSQQWELEGIAQLSGHTFDYWYSKLEVQDHTQDIEETKAEVEKGDNYYVRKLAREDLPMLREHLKLSEQAFNASK